MSYSAKSLLQKAKTIKDKEAAERSSELKNKREQKNIENKKKKIKEEFIKTIGLRCIESALNDQLNCAISLEEIKKYSSEIEACGLQIDSIQLTIEELEEQFPSYYTDLGIDEMLDAISDELDTITDSDNSTVLNSNLADYNNDLYDLLIDAKSDDWHLTYIENKIIDEILETNFSYSDDYSSDDEMFQCISCLLEVLQKYKLKGIRDPDCRESTEASKYIKKLIGEIPKIIKALEKHDSFIFDTKKRIEELTESRESLLSRKFDIDLIYWDYEEEPIIDRSFPSTNMLRWITRNPLMKDLFRSIEKKMLGKTKSHEMTFNVFGHRYVNGKYLCDGLYYEDFLVEISINDLKNIFECLGYTVSLNTIDYKKIDDTNLTQKHNLKVSWLSF